MARNRKPLDIPIRVQIYSGTQKIFEKLFESYPIVIGRSPKCDVPLSQFDFVSRQHVVVTVEDREIKVVDLGSSNGIYVAGQRVKSSPIHNDFEFHIGTIRIRFETEEVVEEHTPTILDSAVSTPQVVPPPTPASVAKPKVVNTPSVPDKPEYAVPRIVSRNPEQEASARPSFETPKKLESVPTAPPVSVNANVQSVNLAQPEIPQPPKKHEKPHEPALTPSHPRPEFGSLKAPIVSAVGSDVSFSPSGMISPHPLAHRLGPKQRVLEGYVTWKDQIFDVSQFKAGSKVTVGSEKSCGLKLPTIKESVDFAFYDGNTTKCFVPDGFTVQVDRKGQKL